MSTLAEGAVVQGRVLTALMLREIHTINGNSKLGYLWVLIQSVFGIAVFWGVRAFMGAHAPHGMSVPIFLAIGFGLWNIFSGGITRCMNAVDGNRGLLTFPQVTEFDVMLARVIVITATQILTSAIIIAVSVLFGSEFRPASAPLFLLVLITVPLLSLGMGMVLSSLAVFLPVLEKLVPMALRILFFVSGVFFVVSAFSHQIAEWLLFNPLMQGIELMRMALHMGYVTDGLDPEYLCAFTVISLTLGGLFERYVRRRRLSQ